MDDGTQSAMQQRVLDALSLEYDALRQELSDRLGNRQRTVTVLGASAALLAGLGGRNDDGAPWLVITTAVALVVVAAGAWAHNGRMIGHLSARLAQLEVDINDAIRDEFVAPQVMTWHSGRQDRDWLSRLTFGRGVAPTSRRTN